MSTPLIWVILPAVAGLVFWLMRRRTALTAALATGLCLVLMALAWQMPIGEAIHLGPLTLVVNSTLDFAGRKLVLDGGDRAFLGLIFLFCSFWFIGMSSAKANFLLIPFGMGMVSLLVAAQAVDPFLYSALLVEMAVLMAVPILAPPGKPFGSGTLRFVIFQTLAMPFILLAGWALGGVEANPSNTTLVTLAIVFLGLGFAFWLAVFPFYTWVPLLAESSDTYSSGFVFFLLPTVNLLIGLNFLNRFGWLRTSPDLFQVISQIGALMVVTAGLWAVFQKDMARLFGYAVIVETGFSLLAISLQSHIGDELFASMFLPRMVAIGLWALSLSIIVHSTRSTRFEDLHSVSTRLPFASAGLAVASLTLAGLPMLAIYPVRQVLLEELAQRSFSIAALALAGMVGMLFSTFRSLAVLARTNSEAEPVENLLANSLETRPQRILLVAGIAILLLIGVFPQTFLHLFNGLLAAYPQLP